MKLIVICAWCERFLGLKDAPGDQPAKSPISHGICPECKRKVEAETAAYVSNPPINQGKEKYDERKR